jgi:hypothetical protein
LRTRRAFEHFQAIPSKAAYEHWRREVLAGGADAQGTWSCDVQPGGSPIGSWDEAFALAADGHPELQPFAGPAARPAQADGRKVAGPMSRHDIAALLPPAA